MITTGDMGMTRLRLDGCELDPTTRPFPWGGRIDNQGILSANNQGTVADAEVTGVDGGLVQEAMDRAFAAQGRVSDMDAVCA
jgi:hypothetical protein